MWLFVGADGNGSASREAFPDCQRFAKPEAPSAALTSSRPATGPDAQSPRTALRLPSCLRLPWEQAGPGCLAMIANHV